MITSSRRRKILKNSINFYFTFWFFFLSIQLLNEFSYPSNLKHNLSPFWFITFSILNYLSFVFRNSVLSTVRTISSVHRNNKTFFRTIWSVSFCRNILIFNIFTWSPAFNLGSLSLFSTSKSKYISILTSVGLIWIALPYVLSYLSIILYNV